MIITPVKITVLPYKPPRKEEKTWPMIKGSIRNIGGKANTLSQSGVTKKKHG